MDMRIQEVLTKRIFAVGLTTLMLILIFSPAGEGDNQLDNRSFEYLIHGDWWTAVVSVFTSVIGEAFFAIVFLLGPALIYIKSQNIVPTAMAIIVGGAVLAVLFSSPIRFFFAIAAIIGVTVILWEMTHK